MGHLILEIQFVFLQIVFFPCSFLKPGMIGNKYYIAIKGLCRGFEFYEVKKKFFLLLFFKKKMEILLHFLSFL